MLLMLDGVRRRDLFGKPEPARVAAELKRLSVKRRMARTAEPVPSDAAARAAIAPDRMTFETLHAAQIQGALVYGRPDSGVFFYSANSVMKSLPAYQSIFAGFGTLCFSNSCGALRRESFVTRLSRARSGSRSVAVIASWVAIDEAVQPKAGNTFVSTGGGWFPEVSAAHRAINDRYSGAVYWGRARLDEQTFAHGEAFLREERPDFLFVSLNDADEWAHLNRYMDYIRTLRAYDAYILTLIRSLSQMPGENWLFVTTDHDRGAGDRWTNHGFELSAASVWLLAFGPMGRGRPGPEARVPSLPSGQPKRAAVHTHLDIRPTIELLLGLEPQSCALCGSPLPEVIRRAERARRGASGTLQNRGVHRAAVPTGEKVR